MVNKQNRFKTKTGLCTAYTLGKKQLKLEAKL